MNRRAFIQGLIGLASMPALSKYINVFRPSAVREGITRAADTTMSKGIEFYEAVIKRVMDEGTVTGEADRWRTYKHPDKPDISVELNVGTGDTAVYFDTDRGSRAGAEISTDIEMPRAGKELMEHEEVYRMGGDDYYKDIDEEITGGVGSLEEWIKRNRGYAAGGRVGMWKGGGIKIGKNVMNLLRNNKKIREAIDNIFPTGDYKMDAEMAVESLVELNPKVFGGKLADDLDDALRSEIYGAVINPIMEDHALLAQMKRASKPRGETKSIIPKDEYAEYSKDFNKEIKEGVADVMKDTSPAGLARSIEIDNLKLEFPGITDEMIENILTDTNPQRIAEVKQTMREALEMQKKGMGSNEIIEMFKNTTRRKQANGGIISLTTNPMTASSKAGVESLFERR